MNKVLKDVFVMLCSTVTVAIVYAILNLLFAAIICLAVWLWGSRNSATEVFKATYIILFVLEMVLTIPVIIRYALKEETDGTESSI